MTQNTAADVLKIVRQATQQPACPDMAPQIAQLRGPHHYHGEVFEPVTHERFPVFSHTATEVQLATTIAGQINERLGERAADPALIKSKPWREDRYGIIHCAISRFAILADLANDEGLLKTVDFDAYGVFERFNAEHLVTMAMLRQKPNRKIKPQPGIYFSADEVAALRQRFPYKPVRPSAHLTAMELMPTRKERIPAYLDLFMQGAKGTNFGIYSKFLEQLTTKTVATAWHVGAAITRPVGPVQMLSQRRQTSATG